jgi:hypothetical protein
MFVNFCLHCVQILITVHISFPEKFSVSIVIVSNSVWLSLKLYYAECINCAV